jgi:hypothetical protein
MEDLRVTGFAPEDAADLGVHIGGDEGAYGGVVAGEAESKVVLELLFGAEAFTQDVLPTGEDAEKAVGSVPEADQAVRFGGGQEQERGGVADLREEGFGRDPLGPCLGDVLRQIRSSMR